MRREESILLGARRKQAETARFKAMHNDLVAESSVWLTKENIPTLIDEDLFKEPRTTGLTSHISNLWNYQAYTFDLKRILPEDIKAETKDTLEALIAQRAQMETSKTDDVFGFLNQTISTGKERSEFKDLLKRFSAVFHNLKGDDVDDEMTMHAHHSFQAQMLGKTHFMDEAVREMDRESAIDNEEEDDHDDDFEHSSRPSRHGDYEHDDRDGGGDDHGDAADVRLQREYQQVLRSAEMEAIPSQREFYTYDKDQAIATGSTGPNAGNTIIMDDAEYFAKYGHIKEFALSPNGPGELTRAIEARQSINKLQAVKTARVSKNLSIDQSGSKAVHKHKAVKTKAQILREKAAVALRKQQQQKK